MSDQIFKFILKIIEFYFDDTYNLVVLRYNKNTII